MQYTQNGLNRLQALPHYLFHTHLANTLATNLSQIRCEDCVCDCSLRPLPKETHYRRMITNPGEQPWNANRPTVVAAGSSMDTNAAQLKKQRSPMDTTASGITIDTNATHSKNACDSMVVTVGGTTTDVSKLQFRNALKLIEVMPPGTTTEVRNLQP
eukprot:m.132132 g.132132  ORF g.132132 m.132132 type:complete len:157 (-) comp22431_c0_seq1:885-1355(-)